MRQKFSFTLLVIFMMTTLPVFSQLLPPADLTATEGSTHHGKYVKLEWTYAAPSPMSFIRFKVFKKHADSTEFFLAASNIRDKRFTDMRVVPGATYQYYVVAYNNTVTSDPSNTAEITLTPPPPPPVFAKITGTVVDAAGLPLKDAFVKAFSQTSPYVRSARTNVDGFFSMTVQTGTYFVQTSKMGYFFEYYDNVTSLADATPVVVNEGDSISLAIDLASFVPPATFTLTGNVTNDLGAAQRAEIYVYKVRANNYHYMVRRTFTDSLGNYSVNVKENDTVIVYAKAPGFAYFPEFYNNKRVIADADKVAITGNVTGIDFVMDPLPVYANGISGVVSDTLGTPVMGYVSAYKVEGTSFGRKSYAVHTDSLGGYSFANLNPGEYVLFVKPQGNYKPTYFRYDGAQAHRRRDADSVVVDETSMITGINFTVIARPDSGWGWIHGKVVAGIGEVAQGSFVYAVDELNEVVAFAMTDNNGNFVLDGVAPGEYTVVPDRADYMNAVTANAVVNLNNFNPFVNVRLENDSPSDAKEAPVVTNYQLAQNFPNPFNPSTTIRYSIPEAGVVTIKVFNILGKEVATLVNGYHQAGSFNVSFDASNLSSGVYLYQIESGSFKATKKLTLIK